MNKRIRKKWLKEQAKFFRQLPWRIRVCWRPASYFYSQFPKKVL